MKNSRSFEIPLDVLVPDWQSKSYAVVEGYLMKSKDIKTSIFFDEPRYNYVSVVSNIVTRRLSSGLFDMRIMIMQGYIWLAGPGRFYVLPEQAPVVELEDADLTRLVSNADQLEQLLRPGQFRITGKPLIHLPLVRREVLYKLDERPLVVTIK
jgi:hypothetical protein